MYSFLGKAILQSVVFPDCLGPVNVTTGYFFASLTNSNFKVLDIIMTL